MTLSPHWLYVGSYAPADQPGIYACTFDVQTGALTAQGAVAGIANPTFVTVHPNRRWLYAVSETRQDQDGTSGAVVAFRIAPAPGQIALINQQASGGDWPCHLALDATGHWLLVANYASGTLGVLPLGPDGGVGEATTVIQHHGGGPHPTSQTGPHTHAAIFAADNRFVIVAELGSDALLVYRFEAQTGRLAEHTQIATQPGAGPRHLVFHPQGRHLYVANELDSTVAVYAYDPADGALDRRQIVATLPVPDAQNAVADIHITPGGERLYVSNRGHDSVAVFDVAADGQLTTVATPSCGGRGPRNFALAPGGRFLLVANQHSGEISVLPVLDGAAALGPPVARAAVPGASCVQFVPADHAAEDAEGPGAR